MWFKKDPENVLIDGLNAHLKKFPPRTRKTAGVNFYDALEFVKTSPDDGYNNGTTGPLFLLIHNHIYKMFEYLNNNEFDSEKSKDELNSNLVFLQMLRKTISKLEILENWQPNNLFPLQTEYLKSLDDIMTRVSKFIEQNQNSLDANINKELQLIPSLTEERITDLYNFLENKYADFNPLRDETPHAIIVKDIPDPYHALKHIDLYLFILKTNGIDISASSKTLYDRIDGYRAELLKTRNDAYNAPQMR